MSHTLTIRDESALDVQALTNEIDALSYERILPNRTTELEVRNGLDGDDDTYGWYHFADTETKADIVADIKALLPDTATVDYRHTWYEYDDTLKNDPAYYPSHWDSGLRAPPTVSEDGKTVDVSVDYIDSGTELSGTFTETFAVPTTAYAQVHTVYANGGGVYVATRDVANNPDKSDSTWDKPTFDGTEVCTLAIKGHIDSIPNGGVEVAEFGV